MDKTALWQRYKQYCSTYDSAGMSLDISRMDFADDFFEKMKPAVSKALSEMDALEKGAIANPDEKRMVGHYWLRAPELAPDKNLSDAVNSAVESIKEFTGQVHSGKIKPPSADKFKNVLLIGIGGSALGPQFVSHALGQADDPMNFYFFDNTDPDGMKLILDKIGSSLKETLSVVISKSGGTKETRNGMLEAKNAYEKAQLDFSKHAVAITGEGSNLEKTAINDGWIKTFPMWDWVGGRTSETSAVGLLPAALQGLDIDNFLAGAKAMDQLTRNSDFSKNPAALISLMWYHSGGGKGSKDMVVLPYKDRLELMGKYLQQLVMESLGKEKDLNGEVVNQGIVVYGNKGSTDQHAYIQQLREGPINFFATFIEVLQDTEQAGLEVEPGITSGDYLQGFFLGTRQALYENGRESMTITIDKLNAFTLGGLIALFERAVGLYATLVNINAYHQPGVEAGKKAAGAVLSLQSKIQEFLKNNSGKSYSAEEIASEIGQNQESETVYKVLQHLTGNIDRGVKRISGETPFSAKYQA